MVDDLFRLVPDDGRLDAPFLSRALEAVLRLAEIYAAQREIQTHRDPAHRADLLRSVADAGPISTADAPTAASPQAVAEPPVDDFQPDQSGQAALYGL